MAHDLTDFDADVLTRSRDLPVLVDFWAPWCGPCLQFLPVLEALAAEAGGKWALVKVNIDEHPDLAATFRVRSVPMVMLFRDGAPAAQFLGARAASQVREFLAPHLPSPENAALAGARQALSDHDPETVRKLLEPLGEKDEESWVLLAQAWLMSDPNRVRECTDRIAPGSKWSSAAEGLLLLAVAIQSAGTIPPGPSRDAYAAGLEAARRLDWDESIEHWMGVMRTDPKFANGSAAEAIKAVFRLLGPRHPTVETHHRSFSSLLYC
ncbi:MAG: hypothetical protein KGS60_06840 [Verrucomicrobia bacterium]|nr:hypothetical protein [Verrucomicrobiota bacterium]